MTQTAKCPRPSGSRWRKWGEITLIFLLFFLHSGWPPPSVNEAHYLAKARSYWVPSWCPGDIFLDSADVHLAFYWSLGWITAIVSLPAAAWIIRLLTWALLACAWWHLVDTVARGPLRSVLAAALLLVGLDRLHLAGEWVIGGAEAKGIAYALVWFALERIQRGRWNAAWLLLGMASAFHVLVGGWSVIAAGIAWWLTGRDSMPLRRMMPGLAAGGLVSLVGVLPPLLSGQAEPAIRQAAYEIYVYRRLPHHLVIHRLPTTHLVRFAGQVALWAGLAWWFRRTAAVRAINAFAAGALAIAAAGILIDQCLLYRLDLAARLLRFYWYRLADAAVPAALSISLLALYDVLQPRRPRVAALLLIGLMAISAGHLWQRRAILHEPLVPLADRATLLAGIDDPQRAIRRYAAWRACCNWITRWTATEAVFVTPRDQQTFKWYAQRSEVANWKDVPQDPTSLVKWWEAIRSLYPPAVVRRGLTAHHDQVLAALMNRYAADYVLLRRRWSHRQLGPPFRRVYPTTDNPNPDFEIYRLEETRDSDGGSIR